MQFLCTTKCFNSAQVKTYLPDVRYDLTEKDVEALGGQLQYFDALDDDAVKARKTELMKATKAKKAAEGAKMPAGTAPAPDMSGVLSQIQAAAERAESAAERAEAFAIRAEEAATAITVPDEKTDPE